MVLRKNRKVSVGVDCKDYFVKSKGGIRRWKLTEVEGRMFDGDYRGCYMHK